MKNSGLLKHILQNTPNGIVITSEYLKQNNVSSKLAWWYVKSHWLERLGDKIYKKVNDHISWEGVVYTLQTIHQINLYVSGQTAIQLSGKSHYFYLKKEKDISISKNSKIPLWFKRVSFIPEKFNVSKSVLLDDKNIAMYLNNITSNQLTIYYSCNELAILEVLSKCKTIHDYEEAGQLMEAFPYLRWQIVQEILEQSSSILATRLYLHLANRYNHEWYKKLDIAKFNLGTGKRRVGEGGFFDKQFQLYVPLQQEY